MSFAGGIRPKMFSHRRGKGAGLRELTLRLQRWGHANLPFYKIIVMHKRKGETKAPKEYLGTYYAKPRKDGTKIITWKLDRIKYYIAHGAGVSRTVQRLLAYANVMHPPPMRCRPFKFYVPPEGGLEGRVAELFRRKLATSVCGLSPEGIMESRRLLAEKRKELKQLEEEQARELRQLRLSVDFENKRKWEEYEEDYALEVAQRHERNEKREAQVQQKMRESFPTGVPVPPVPEQQL